MRDAWRGGDVSARLVRRRLRIIRSCRGRESRLAAMPAFRMIGRRRRAAMAVSVIPAGAGFLRGLMMRQMDESRRVAAMSRRRRRRDGETRAGRISGAQKRGRRCGYDFMENAEHQMGSTPLTDSPIYPVGVLVNFTILCAAERQGRFRAGRTGLFLRGPSRRRFFPHRLKTTPSPAAPAAIPPA